MRLNQDKNIVILFLLIMLFYIILALLFPISKRETKAIEVKSAAHLNQLLDEGWYIEKNLCGSTITIFGRKVTD